MKIFLALIAVLLFAGINSNAQTITITTPNGGEVLYACQQYNVTWTQTGSPSNYWNIDYSLDGGTIWTSVASNYLSANGTFLWTVPNVQSTTVLMRVFDANGPGTVDQSNNYFAINIPVVVTAPNGGESWQGNTVHDITWSTIGTSNTFNLAYSLNNGSTWTDIVTNFNTVAGSYSWTVPSVNVSNQCLVRVMDAVTNCMQDISNVVFTITPPTPQVTYPNGGEQLYAGCAVGITWNPASYFSNVQIEYSLNGGVSFTIITSNTSNDGFYNWTPPSTPDNEVRIRVCNVDNLSINDVSDANFVLLPTIRVVSPNGGEAWTTCSTYNIVIDYGPCVSTIGIQYSTDNGVTWNGTSTSLVSVSGNQRTYSWMVPNTMGTAAILIRSYDAFNSSVFDATDAQVNVAANTVITVTAPNGGESIAAGSNYSITWNNTAPASGVYNIQFSLNNGSSWSTVVNGISGNAYNWTVNNSVSTQCLIRVLDANNTCYQDQSNATFSITGLIPTMTSPNGGESFYAGCSNSITWNSSTFYNSVRIEYSPDGGSTWTTITASTSNDGSYPWSIPNITGSNYLVKVSQTDNLALNDVSDAVFTIVPHITVVSPNGGETWTTCSTQNVVLNFDVNCFSSVGIQYSTDNGVTWTGPGFTFVSASGNDRTYSWTVSNTITTPTILIRAYDAFSSSYTDVSDGPINIIPNTVLDVMSPDGGETLPALSQQTITWTNTAQASGLYNLSYSTNNGSSWSTIVNGISGNAYNWTVANIPSTQCLIIVQDAVNTCFQNNSSAVFTISPQAPVMTAPNGGESLYAGCSNSITWNSSTFYNSVRIEYSPDGGSTWTTITASTSNDGSYPWSIPNITGSNYLVKVSQTDNLALNDVSDAVFTIVPHITVVSPNGGETWTTCSTQNVVLNFDVNCFSSVGIQYSTDNGVTWTGPGFTFVSASGNDRTYSWTVSNTITTPTILIRAYDAFSSSYFDVSDGPINIIPNTVLDVTSPDGGETLPALSQQTITWTNTAQASGLYNLSYSTNNGSSWSTIVNGISGNAYNWTVANIPSTQCLIRVQDAVNTCFQNNSSAVFTISPQAPVMTAPNGGESFYAGCSNSITWNSSTFYNSVRIEYSPDGGSTWTTITASTSNDGSYPWSIPNITGSNYLVKVSQTDNLALNDVSDGVFTIVPHITVVSPNGGETWTTCSTQNVVLNFDVNCFSTVGIQYSTDNGVTWTGPGFTFVSASGNDRTYSWTVSNTITTPTILIRAYDAFSSSYFDVSDGPINIIPNTVLDVTSPDGGETLPALSQQTITWTNTAQASGLYNLSYSTNNGSSWSTIVNGISGNAYNWTVANIPSTQCLIRVQDAVNTCFQNNSSAVFTISPQAPVMTAPNGGESLYAGCSNSITWNSSTFYNSVRIEYSPDGGSTWTTITASTSNDGSYPWSIPNITGSNYLVKVSQTDNLALNDVSDAVFTIVPHITVVSPNGGETWTTCSTQNVVLNFDPNCFSSVGIQYSTDNGVTWTGPGFSWIATNGNERTYSWTVSNTITTPTILIRAYDAFNSSYADVSDGPINIIPNTVLDVTSPDGGETLPAMSEHTITWTNTAQASGLYNLYYSTNNGASWTAIVNGISGNAYNWTVANIPSTQCLIRVQDAVNTCYQNNSSAVFTIAPQTAQLTSPNGGEILYAQNSAPITWNSSTFYNSVRLEYSIDGGLTWVVITASTSNDGSYPWTPPQADSDECLVRISQTDNLNQSDVSDAFFTINPAVTIITPNGDNGVTIWGGCTVTSITFDHSPAYTAFKLEYSTNNGATWTVITNSYSATVNPATYNWTMPNIPTAQALVRVSPTSNLSYFDVSDDTFTITKPVTIIQPNFGGIMQVGSTFNIQWTSDGISNFYDIFYSTDGGTNFTNIVTGYNTSNNTYPWLVPNIPSTNCRIWVRDNINYCKADTSDVAFVISTTAPPLTITTPNGIADTLSGCSAFTISWTESSDITSYDIAYSLNNGVTWTDIVTNYNAPTNSYDWTVPNDINSTSVLLRVRSSSQPATYDLTDAYINVFSGEMIATPEFVSECSNVPIQLSATGGSNYTWSPSIGLDDPNIADPIAMPLATTTYTVTSDVNGCILSDEVTLEVTQSGVPATINIDHDQTDVICEGTLVTFNATIESGGAVPHYQWKVNGMDVGTNSSSYATDVLTATDVIVCVLTSDLPCVSNNPATSNVLQLDIQENVTPSVAISSSTGNTICIGQDVVFTAVPQFGGLNPQYAWTLNGDPVGAGEAVLEGLTLSDGDNIGLTMLSDEFCLTTSSVSAPFITMNVGEIPAQPGSIMGDNALCEGEAAMFSISAIADATDYIWSVPLGWTVSDMGTMISVITSGNSGTVSVAASNGCGTSEETILDVIIDQIPVSPIGITGPASVCLNSDAEYVIAPVSGATSYVWTVPDSWSGSSASSSIMISFDDFSLTDVLYVAAQNDCGISATQSIDVNVGSASELPAVIVGNASPCAGESVTYVIDEYFGALTYNWILPDGWSGSSSTYSIDVVSGDSDGQISVQAVTNCGNSPERILDIVIQSAPIITSEITGETLLCVNSEYEYSIEPVSNADSYTWSFPAGWLVDQNANTATAMSETNAGFIEVFASNECGSSESVQILVDVLDVPATPFIIDGPVEICENADAVYSIDPTEGATSYSWTMPLNWVGAGNTTTLNATVGNTSGLVSVFAINECGVSETISLDVTVNNTPQLSGIIQGETEVCVGTSQSYSIDPVVGVTSYDWVLPVGWSGNSNIEMVDVVSANAGGVISVSASNDCGPGNSLSLNIVVNDVSVLSDITGPSELCEGESQLFSVVQNDEVDSYNWSVPADWSLVGSESSVSVTVGQTSGEISVSGSNLCGNSEEVNLLIVVNPLPVVNATALPSNEICDGDDVALFGDGAQDYVWTLGVQDGVAFTPAGSATYSVTGTDANNCSSTVDVSIVVHDLPTVALSLTGDEVQCIETASMPLAGGTPAGGVYSGDGVIGSSLIPEVAGVGAAIIQYAYTDEFGCTNFAEDFYIIEVCDAVHENDLSEMVVVYPNPSAGLFTVVFSDAMSTVGTKNLVLFDLTGRIIYQVNSSLNQESFDFSDLAAGQYFMRIDSDHGNAIVKISIDK
ncbi:MAG: T9SS type A sorting domain-containing protein [Flavobacteriales bacterium]|nr:T9SS type A sorting domain-containing protein [Flavobacteriales bacterium]